MSYTSIPLTLQTKAGQVKIVSVFSDSPFHELLALKQQYLHQNELQYFDLLAAEKRRYSYLHGRYVAKKALETYSKVSELSEIEIGYGVFYQPVVYYEGLANVHISIAHSDNKAVAIAFPESCPLGIDIEKIDHSRNWNKLMPLTIQELKMASQLNLKDTQVFTLFWTIKEALSKALKLGFTVDMKLYEIASCKRLGDYVESTFICFKQHKAYSWYTDQYCCTVVLPGTAIVDAHLLSKIFTSL